MALKQIKSNKTGYDQRMRKYSCIFLAVLVSILTHLYVSPEYPESLVFTTASLFIILALGLTLYFSKNLIHLPIIIPTLILWVYFCAPFFYSEFPDWDSRRVVDPIYFNDMALFSSLSILAMVGGYYLPFRLVRIQPIFYPKIRLHSATMNRYAWIFLAAWWVYSIIEQIFPIILLPFGQTIAIFENFNLFGFALALVGYLRKKHSVPLLTFAGFSFFTDILVTIHSTLFARVAYLLISIMVILFIENRKFPWKTTLLIFLTAFPIFLARMSHRGSRYWNDDLTERISEGLTIAAEDIISMDWNQMGEEFSSGLGTRFEGVSFLAHCIYLHDQGKSFKNGSTFWFIPLSVVPRFLFPWKPENDHGDRLSTEYGFKDPGPYVSINFLWLAELYINFNFFGMVLGSFVMGSLIRFASICCCYGIGDLNMLIFLHLLKWLTNMESNLAMVAGGILQTLVAWWILSFFLKKGRFRYHRYSTQIRANSTIQRPLTASKPLPSMP